MKTDVIINRDALCALQELPSESVHCCVTSPPYFALRDYGLDAQIGQEDTPEQYIDRLTAVFGELYRVLRKDGTLWLNIADTYCGTGNKGGYADPKNPKGRTGQRIARNSRVTGCKQKDLIGIPWLLAFSLREQGWYLRSDIIWQKQNPMPESCKDRPTRCYEHIFLLSKEKKYYYDAAAIAEPLAPTTAKLLLEAIRALPEERRKIVLLYYFEGLTDIEIAKQLNISRSTVQYRRTSSFEQLKKYLEENADEWIEW